ncbi:two-component regulator propeller domain-containing protein [Pedobacter miscanthi]|jgi:ligand-binding sensor domain-containing protein/DNA-binding response OmpR family regulator|uniref:hybrid sensor histidine kinase/response regulator n=1 Tax=Pedobacter miscanthi TaxID=2259170 RepID=UPI00292F2D6B|nr:two-component regulator propeller domain-containing protein [Pedobacter miscanthi]
MFTRFLKYLLCASLFLGYLLPAKCQQPIQFDHLGVEKGLSQTSVLAITQDKNGFMWFGTRYGLNRYDGYNIKVYQSLPGDSLSISSNYVINLFSDSRKNLWVGTDRSLNRYNEKTDHFERIYSRPNGISNNVINCITEDKKGNIWIGTLNGLNLLVNGDISKIKVFFNNKSANKLYRNIRAVKQDHEGNIWVGTSNGLLKMTFKNGAYQTIIFKSDGKPGAISENYITGIIEDRQQKLWISTQDNGLNLFIPASKTFKIFNHSEQKNSLVNSTIRTMVLDDIGKLWIGTLDGISVMDTRHFTFTNLQYDPSDKKSLSQNSVHRLYKDQNGSIWAGTYFGGVNINYPYTTAFNIYSTNKNASSVSNNAISTFAEDEHKNLWIGTEGGGLNYFNRLTNKFTAFKSDGRSNSIKSNLIKKIILDKKGKLWIGTHSGGLNFYDSKKGSFGSFDFSAKQEDVPDEVTAVAEDQHGRLYAATQRNGIKISNPEKTKFYNFELPARFPDAGRVKSMLITDRVYLGTTNGLCIYNINKKEFYTLKDPKTKQVLEYYVNGITETSNKEIYISTNNQGLIRYDQKANKMITYTVKNGLPNDNVLGVLEDDKDNLWISTANGLSMFNRKNKTFKNYTVADGLPGNEFNANAFFKNSNGEMFFGGYNGFISFYPDRIQTNNKAASLVITGLKVDNQDVKINAEDGLLDQNIGLKDKLEFASNQNTFSLSFALLNFIKPEKNRYAYKLEGFEKNWNEVNIPTASYTNLPPGSYTFMVKGVNNDGISGANIRKIYIIVKPPFYRSWWAYLVYFCVVAAIAIVFVRYLLIRAVLKKEKEINEHKLEFFTNISHEIRTPLTLIVGPLDKLIENAKDDPALNRDLQPIKNNADRLMNLVTELLDFRKAESGKMTLHVSPGNVVKFCREIFLAFQNMAIAKNIDYAFECEQAEMALYFDKVQMEKVLFNLLSNAFKFTPVNGKISLKIFEENQNVNIQICDNGKGIPLENQPNLFTSFYQANASSTIGTGLGLSLSKSIVELHHGKISFSSTPKTDHVFGNTCFTVSLKTGKTHFSQEDFMADYIYYDDAAHYNLPALPEIENIAKENGLPLTATEKDKKSILLVEDNEDVRTFIKNALKDKYIIYERENGATGLTYALELIPDLIISDIMMPVMDGLELCRKLKTDESTSHIPVVLLTARSAYVHQINGFENGADAYLMKPFNLKILKLNIQNLLTARETIKQKFAQVITLEPKNLVINSTEQNFLNKIIQVIEERIADPDFDVPTLASAIGMSQPVLYKKIRALTDLSVNDFIKSLRIKRAAQLLKQGTGNVSEIAYAVGFSDRKYFSSEFKKHFGKTPSEFMGNG